MTTTNQTEGRECGTTMSADSAVTWATTAAEGEYLAEYDDTAEDPGSRCGYDDATLSAIRDALRKRELTLSADDVGLVVTAVRA